MRAVTSIDVAEFPIHLALTDSAYAFDRPPFSDAAGVGENVEVHALDGRLLWASHTSGPVAGVMLGGGTLAVLTDAVSPANRILDLWTSTSSHPDPLAVDQAGSSAALSPDGQDLAWDAADQGQLSGADPNAAHGTNVEFETVADGNGGLISTATDGTTQAPVRPGIWSVGGRLLITWLTTAPSGTVYPAVEAVGGGDGVFLPSPLDPIWIGVEGSTLIWVAESADGWTKAAFAVDLADLGLR